MSDNAFLYTLAFNVIGNAFTHAELDTIEAYCDRLPLESAGIFAAGVGASDHQVRITQTAWIAPNADIMWFYHRIEEVVHALNEQIYQFDLRGFSEPFQYTVYHGAEGGHYDWHVDQGVLKAQRKLSLSLQLSDPSQYEGCELQAHSGNDIVIAPKDRGVVIAFPSYVLHRVTPIVSGTRKVVVIWNSGPKFR